MRVVVAQCTNTKRDERAPVRRLYDESAYFRRQRAYAEARGDRWFIQSALYGLLHPDKVVAPYDKRPRDLDDTDEWAREIAADLDEHVPAPAVVELLGGKSYTDPLTPELEARGFDVVEPLRGLGIGERRSKLSDMTSEVANATLHG